MIVTLDGAKLDGMPADPNNLRTVLDHVRRTCASDRLIVSVTVNGRAFIDSALQNRLSQAVGCSDQVDLESVACSEIVDQALSEMAARLDDASFRQTEISASLAAGDIPQALMQMGEFVEMWQNCQETLVQCSAALDRDLTQIESGGRSVLEHVKDLAEKLRDLRSALDGRDYVLLADLVRYELPSLCETWKEIMTDLAAAVESASMTNA